jgi:hypothetical protein
VADPNTRPAGSQAGAVGVHSSNGRGDPEQAPTARADPTRRPSAAASSNGAGDAGSPPDFCLGGRGSVVLVGAELDLAGQLRRVILPAVCGIQEMPHVEGVVERRAAIVAYFQPLTRTSAVSLMGWIAEQCHPERIGLLDLRQMGFSGPAAAWVSWWAETLEAGRYDDGPDFLEQAALRATWRTADPARAEAKEEEPPIPVPEWPGPPAEAAYYGLAGDVVRTLAPQSEADPAAILFQLLCAFGSVIGRKPHVKVGRTRHHANENALLVGRTSASRKGTSWEDVSPVLLQADPEWRRARVLNGLTTGEGVIHAVRDPLEDKEPVREKGRVVEYQAVVVDHGVDDKRLFVMEPEFGRVLQVMGREASTLSAVLRMAWDGVRLAVMTKKCPYAADEAHIGVVGHITVEELSALLSECDIANGLVNRFLLVCCRRSQLLPFGGRVDPAEMDALGRRLLAAVAFARETDEVRWTREAMAIWEDQYPRLAAARGGAYGLATSRAEAHTLRLALQYALLDLSDRIHAVHLLAALAAWDYCRRCARHIFGDRTGDHDADRILDALRGAPDGMTRTQIRREIFYDHRSADVIAAKLSKLLEMQLVERQSIPTSGRPAEVWRASAASVCVKSVESPPEVSSPMPSVYVKSVESPPYHAFHVHATDGAKDATEDDLADMDWTEPPDERAF